MNNCIVTFTGALGLAIGAPTLAATQDVLTTHRLSAALVRSGDRGGDDLRQAGAIGSRQRSSIPTA